MQLINPSYKILDIKDDLLGAYEAVEVAGRTCYKSEGNIKYDENGRSTSARDFVLKMVQSGHMAMLEHGTVYLTVPKLLNIWQFYEHNSYSRIIMDEEYVYITTNLRVIWENNLHQDLGYATNATEHERRYMVRLVTDRGVSHEAVRHKKFSFAMESTRYCNYSKDRFNNELTFILPPWFVDKKEGVYNQEDIDSMLTEEEQQRTENRKWCLFLSSCLISEQIYLGLIKDGQSPQQARQVLNHAIKTELVLTAFPDDWQHFFNLRSTGTTGAPHPSIKQLADPLYEEFRNRKFL